jgi:para-nitrobenzyl esterase
MPPAARFWCGSTAGASRRAARRGDVVVVTLNYRLGALGYLALSAAAEEEGGSLGNLGLLDQIEALRWVRDHIALFGGDPANVTIFGESAGAMSVATLLAVPAARGLFARVVLQSGAGGNVHDRDTAERVAETFMKEMGLAPADLSALRGAPVDALLEAQEPRSAPWLERSRVSPSSPCSTAIGSRSSRSTRFEPGRPPRCRC